MSRLLLRRENVIVLRKCPGSLIVQIHMADFLKDGRQKGVVAGDLQWHCSIKQLRKMVLCPTQQYHFASYPEHLKESRAQGK
jgi:hypothetical protein